MQWWQPAYIALGSNLDDPVTQVRRAFDSLTQWPQIQCAICSPLYRSMPMGPQDQPDFVNAVAGLLTSMTPDELLTALQTIEQRMGRVRVQHWGPRIIDLDILLLGDTKVDSPNLRLPHPGMLERNFVMVPLADIAPTLRLANGRLAQQLASQLGAHGLERLHD